MSYFILCYISVCCTIIAIACWVHSVRVDRETKKLIKTYESKIYKLETLLEKARTYHLAVCGRHTIGSGNGTN